MGGKFGWLPEGLICRGYSGTSVAFGKHSEGGRKVYRIGSRLELRDRVSARAPGRVAHSHDIRENVLWFGTRGHVSSSERAPEGGVLRASFRMGLPEGLPGGCHRVVRLEINGWDSSFRSDRLNCSKRRWPSDSKWATKIDSLDRAEARSDRTGRTAEHFLAVGSDVDSFDLNREGGGFLLRGWRQAKQN